MSVNELLHRLVKEGTNQVSQQTSYLRMPGNIVCTFDHSISPDIGNIWSQSSS